MEDQWATVELMGHAQTAGRIDFAGSLLRVDVPDGENWRTEYYGMAAIYAVKLVSEEIARAFVHRFYDAMPSDAPIVTREQHQEAVYKLEQQNHMLRGQVNELERGIESVLALPDGNEHDEDDGETDDDDRDIRQVDPELGW